MRFGFESKDSAESLTRRGYLARMTAMYFVITGVCLAFGGLALVNIFSGDPGFLIMLLLLGLPGLLTAILLRQYVRDLSALPVTIEGEVQRKWHKSNLMFFFLPAFYINVERKIFSIPQLAYASLLETDLVRIRCYPHSLTVENVERYDEYEKRFVPADVGATS